MPEHHQTPSHPFIPRSTMPVETAAEEVVETITETVTETITEPAVEAAPAAEPTSDSSAPDVGGSEEMPTWDGEIASVESQDWWAQIPEDQRDAVREGLRAKHKHWDGSYTQKLQSLAEQRKEVEAAAAHAEAVRKKALTWLHGTADPTTELNAEISSLKSKLADVESRHQVALTTLREEHTLALERASRSGAGEVERVMAEAKAHREELEQLRAAEAARADETAKAEAAALEARIREEAPDLMEGNDEGFFDLATLLKTGFDFDQALKMVRVRHPGPSKPVEEDDAEDLMSSGGPGISLGGKEITLEQLMKQKQRDAGVSFSLPE